jgi:sugar phosphate isomerase/epimerase
MRSLSILALLFCSIVVKSQTEIGLELYSLRNQFAKDVPGTFAKVKQMGFRELELGGTYGMDTTAFVELLKNHGFQTVSVGSDFNLLATNPEKIVRFAKLLGASYVVVFWIPHKGNDFTVADADKAIEVFNRAGKVLKENGLSLCYHPHGYEFRPHEGATLFDYLMKNMDPQYANFEMDVFWIKHPGQDPVALLEKYPNRFPLMHLKDRKPGTPGNQNGQADVESNVVLGAGDVGIADIMRVSKKVGVKHYFIEDESSRSETQMPESLKFLRSIK